MRHPSRCVAILLATLFVAQATFAQSDNQPFSRRNPVVEAVNKTKSSIVCVRITRQSGVKETAGTGVIIDERGLVITNNHVVGKNRSVIIRMHDGVELSGDVIIAEARYDLAVVRIRSANKLTSLPLAPVADLMVGETVIAIGHPFGYTNTVSTGIISALGREITLPSGDVLKSLIQTNAAINPGNSGGPLLNINGEFIGVNVALREGAQGIAFAINAATVKHFLNQNLNAQKIAGVQHGLEIQEKIIAETGDRARLVVDSPLGVLESGDEIVMVGNVAVRNTFDLERSMWERKPGDTVELKVVRQGTELKVALTLAAGQGAGTVASGSQAHPDAVPTRTTTTYVSVPTADRR
jgi:serine protease Do